MGHRAQSLLNIKTRCRRWLTQCEESDFGNKRTHETEYFLTLQTYAVSTASNRSDFYDVLKSVGGKYCIDDITHHGFSSINGFVSCERLNGFGLFQIFVKIGQLKRRVSTLKQPIPWFIHIDWAVNKYLCFGFSSNVDRNYRFLGFVWI